MPDPSDIHIRHRFVTVDGLRLFYREAGPPAGPVLLLLHGFPTSSRMFRHLMPALAAEGVRVVAPDYPGFGLSDFPAPDRFPYSFAALTDAVDGLTSRLGLERYALFVQDYGAPIGFRLALAHPERVTGLVVQNGNAYREGLSPEWAPLEAYWREPTAARRAPLRGWLTPDGVRLQYVAGLPDELVERIAPETWMLDWQSLERPGNIDMQLDLLLDYRENVALYGRIQQYFRDHRPPALIVWGRHDPFFSVAGAEAYLRDLPDAELHLIEAGHFALETHWPFIAGRIAGFVPRLDRAVSQLRPAAS